MSEAIPSRKHRILSTEDDGDTREVLRLLLELESFEVVSVEKPAQAISLAKAEKFDLYLLDNWLPGMPGTDLCRQLRAFDSATPILFYSGAASEADKARALAAGAQGYVIKPSEIAELVGEIKRLLLMDR